MKKGKKQKQKVKLELRRHQHIDEHGRRFGAEHPADMEHKNLFTQKAHELTVRREFVDSEKERRALRLK